MKTAGAVVDEVGAAVGGAIASTALAVGGAAVGVVVVAAAPGFMKLVVGGAEVGVVLDAPGFMKLVVVADGMADGAAEDGACVEGTEGGGWNC